MNRVVHLPEVVVPGKRLGRHIVHDPRSRAFQVSCHASPLVSWTWRRDLPALDQGDLGSCTANAIVGCLATAPFLGRTTVTLDEALAVRLYEAATRLDYIPGHYPPTDTGSSGLAAAKAATRDGLMHSYHHAFGLNAALAALGHVGPVIIGVNWYDSFDVPVGPNAELVIGPGARVRGGHEVELVGVDVALRCVYGFNSWGTGWGNHGQFEMSWDTFARLLSEGGDCTVPVP